MCTPIILFPADPICSERGSDVVVRSADVICSERVTMHCQWGGKAPKIAPSPWDFVTLPEDDLPYSNMHKKFGKDRACGSGDNLSDRQTDTQTQTDATEATDHNTSSPLPPAR